MAKLNGKGPEEKGPQTGRGLGRCTGQNKTSCSEYTLGEGMGKRRKAGLHIEETSIIKQKRNENSSTN